MVEKSAVFRVNTLVLAEGREQYNVSYRSAVRQEHAESVYAIADAACGRHSDFHCVEEILVGVVGFFIACCRKCVLRGKTFSLVNGIIEF